MVLNSERLFYAFYKKFLKKFKSFKQSHFEGNKHAQYLTSNILRSLKLRHQQVIHTKPTGWKPECTVIKIFNCNSLTTFETMTDIKVQLYIFFKIMFVTV